MFIKHKAILIISADNGIPRQLSPVLNSIGFDICDYAESAYVAFDKIANNSNYDCLLLDLNLEKQTAFLFIEFILQHNSNLIKTIPIICMIGAVSEFEVNFLSEMAIQNFIMKPVTEKVAEGKIREFISEYQDVNSAKYFHHNVLKLAYNVDIQQAIDSTKERIKLFPKMASMRLLHAKLLMLANLFDEAQAELASILKALNNNVLALDYMGKIQFQRENFVLALQLFEKAQQLSPLNMNRALMIAELLLASGRATIAESKFKHILMRYPDLEIARVGLDRSLVEQGRINEDENFAKDPAVRKELISHLNLKGVVLSKKGKYKEAVIMYTSAIQLVEDKALKASLHYNIALAWNKSGDAEKAKNACKFAISNDGKHQKAIQLYATLQIQKARPAAETKETNSTPVENDNNSFIVSEKSKSSVSKGIFSEMHIPELRVNTIDYGKNEVVETTKKNKAN